MLALGWPDAENSFSNSDGRTPIRGSAECGEGLRSAEVRGRVKSAEERASSERGGGGGDQDWFSSEAAEVLGAEVRSAESPVPGVRS